VKRVAAVAVLAVLLAPSGGTAAQTVRLTIQHVVQNCHVWKSGTKSLGPSTKVTVARGARVVIRSDCPMDFDFAQVKGPKLALGDTRMYTGQSKTLVFRKAGTYRISVTNVQTPEERGLVVLGQANTLSLTVVVK
jgi:hypothetical protein